ncbi:hypothetical protein MUK42_27055 [Musa troglodytarum]|uniref:PSP proline-rich domain-containing protein n=1 Tax=Musa troglodytarum TaxID=320322 RepID=A0A9E7JRI0_9LILI|nr:hypothetical protein MUK42_27055 [Musa troglodytarum]
MLAVFHETVAHPPQELRCPESTSGFPPKPGYRWRHPKNPDEILRDFLSSHPAHSFCATFSGGAALACLGPQAPHPSLLCQRFFCSFDEVYCIFVGSISNLSSLVREYGLCGRISNEALLVIEAYRTLRDRGPYPADKVVEDLAGSFAFVVYDNMTGAVFAALSGDGGVPLYWGIAADGSVVICDDVEIMKGSCAKSYAPFPTGCMFHSEGGLRSFEHPMNRMKAMPRVDSEGAMCGASFMVDAASKIAAIPRRGLRSFEHPMNRMKAMPRVDSEGAMCGASFMVDAASKIAAIPRCSSDLKRMPVWAECATMTAAELGIQSSYPNGAGDSLTNGGLASAAAAEKKKARDSERRRRRRKQKKNNKASSGPADEAGDESDGFEGGAEGDAKENSDPRPQVKVSVEVEYVPEKADVEESFLEDFRSVLEKFSFQDAASAEDEGKKDEAAGNAAAKKRGDSDSEEEEQEAQQKEKGLSNKKKKLQRRMKIADLKQICSRPDVVEVWDATAADPKLLVFLKSYRNTVPVPRHWCQKRKFLQGKRGIEKQPFQLPDFIAATGIEKIRQAYIEKEDSKKLKQKQRERMQPKMGKMDIDYQVLHDAFFKYQTKPKLTTHGDLYFEGKEFEVKLREMKPGMLSRELKEALGMPDGAPPPWLINMQRYGPPPSYPQLKIPGLNAPIPPGASFGYHPGGWGKPPVDEYGRPLYGDVFGVQQQEQLNYEEEPVDRSKHWGDLEEEEEEEEMEEEEEEEEEMEEEELEAGMQSVDSLSSTPTGVETPDVIDLRKQQRKEPEKPLYQVLEEKEERIAPGTLLGTAHTYVLGAQEKTAAKRVDLLRGQKSDKVDVTIQPEELEVMDDVLAAKYEEAREEEKLRNQKEDFSDMVAEQAANKRKRKEKDGKSKKKDFKF